MAHQEEGWPLGLQPLSARVGLVRNRDCAGSTSFSTLLTASLSSSTVYSSDLDTESTDSFFPDKSITLGSLIGISNLLELSQRRGRTSESLRDRKNCKSKNWCFSLCSKLSTDVVSINGAPSLGHFLEVERRTANLYRRNQSPMFYGPDDFSQALPVSEANSLFVSGQVAPPQSNPILDDEIKSNRFFFGQGNKHGAPLLCSCLCGEIAH